MAGTLGGGNAPTVRAIETEYKGVRFRSRLEARWAVFFDSLPTDWLYEPEAFTDGQISYLPDFYLPESECYWEVKPDGNFDIDKVRVAVIATRRPIVISQGSPGEDNLRLKVLIYGQQAVIEATAADLLHSFLRSDSAKSALHAARSRRFWDPETKSVQPPKQAAPVRKAFSVEAARIDLLESPLVQHIIQKHGAQQALKAGLPVIENPRYR